MINSIPCFLPFAQRAKIIALHGKMAFLIYLKNPDKMLIKGAILMKTEYDISTKDKEVSYLELVDEILFSKLGLKPANSGSRYESMATVDTGSFIIVE